MAKSKKRKLGDVGEDIACKYLQNKGYSVLERNYWKPWGEIDIVAKKGNLLSFVEVKSVSREAWYFPSKDGSRVASDDHIRPEENMHEHKLRRLHRAIQTYLMDRKVPEDVSWQVDLACVYLDFSSRKARVELLENVL